jgi:hypothetical protein
MKPEKILEMSRKRQDSLKEMHQRVHQASAREERDYRLAHIFSRQSLNARYQYLTHFFTGNESPGGNNTPV